MKIRARENPFESERVEALLGFEPEWLGQTWPGLMERLRGLEYCAAIVGPHGSGKTTLLSGLKPRLEEEGMQVESFFLNDEKRSLGESDWGRLGGIAENRQMSMETVIFLDGAEQMSWRCWRRFGKMANRCRGLVLTQHRLGKLPVLVRTETSLEMLGEFIRCLAPGFSWEEGEVERMYLRSSGNVREALWLCYDWVASRECSI